ncbi:MAG: Uma2 family endonuclease [Tepidisphaeraceae bacterium]
MTLAEPTTRRWTRDEYYRLADEGWFVGQRVQLFHGEIVQMPPQGHQHAKAMLRVSQFLQSAFGSGHWIRTQLPLNLLEDSEPEPDVAVTKEPAESYQDHPTTALLVVEISDSSLRLDRRKAGLYSSAEIPEYWIVNLSKRSLEVHRGPVADPKEEFGHRYFEFRELNEAETAAPLAKPDAQIQVKRFFD